MRSLATIHLTITEQHVESMLDRYDSGMCDRSRSNAVYLALQCYVSHPGLLRVTRCNDRLMIFYGPQNVAAPAELGEWLAHAEKGFASTPSIRLSIPVQIPLEWLKSPRTHKLGSARDSKTQDQIAA